MSLINQISSANTFLDWLNATRSLIEHSNYFSSNVESVIIANTLIQSANVNAQIANTNAWTARAGAIVANNNAFIARSGAEIANSAAWNARSGAEAANALSWSARSGAETANINAWIARSGAEIANTNAWEALQNTTVIIDTVPSTNKGITGHLKGMIFLGNNYFYYCTSDYDGTTNIWSRISSTDIW